ncbi:hypothetical protein F3Y22_tig00111774pilonHSYRG00034 [Hibiscus syriacus]|uniref:Reverse transcriptase zinc-binding domain-containing protein n=1 Tax=Hibiscus syriacus TaxID=106335 RepID=A0A6A2YFI8_HIBSY|nr:hypothetical protein F3Y22_tig00111774pilonHSYRG00034 [Hibiscus syriacus]
MPSRHHRRRSMVIKLHLEDCLGLPVSDLGSVSRESAPSSTNLVKTVRPSFRRSVVARCWIAAIFRYGNGASIVDQGMGLLVVGVALAAGAAGSLIGLVVGCWVNLLYWASGLGLQNIIWKANPTFRRHFKDLGKHHKLKVTAIFETRISGDKADRSTGRRELKVAILHKRICQPKRDGAEGFMGPPRKPKPWKRRSLATGGDFNTTLDERRSKVDQTEIMGGANFTWKRGSLWKRFDRCLFNEEWAALFPISIVTHIDRVGSDHCPLLFHQPKRNDRTSDRPFRIRGIDKTLRRNYSERLIQLDTELRTQLDEVLAQEESLWIQKSRQQWVTHGDKNTKFFHASTMQCRRTNYINSLKTQDGSWCSDQNQFRTMIVEFCKELFSKPAATHRRYAVRGSFPDNPGNLQDKTTRLITKEEIKQVMLDMAPLKAPGVDGFHAMFYQRNWEMVDDSVCHFVTETSRHYSRNSGQILPRIRTKVMDFGRYLGVPLLHNRVTTATYQHIIQRVRDKLAGWVARSLSLAGRISLAKSVLATISFYTMQSTPLPKSTCNEIEKVIRNFIWDKSEEKQGISLVKWDSVCTPITHGGLGFKSLEDQNDAFLRKVAFNLITRPTQLWAQVLRSKYKWNESVPENITRKNCSRLWNGISVVWGMFVTAATLNIPEVSIEEMVDQGKWKWNMINPMLPQHIIHRLMATMTPKQEQAVDTPEWKWNPDRVFTVRSAYEVRKEHSPGAPEKLWKTIAQLQGLQRIKIFLWLVACGKILMNSERTRRHMDTDNK